MTGSKNASSKVETHTHALAPSHLQVLMDVGDKQVWGYYLRLLSLPLLSTGFGDGK